MRDVVAKFEFTAGISGIGQVLFRAINPVTGLASEYSIYIIDLERFCRDQNLHFDRDYLDDVLSELDYDPKTGWIVPVEHLDRNMVVTSAQAYLNLITDELF